MALETWLALAGIGSVVIGTAMTLYGIFAAPDPLTYATFEAGHRDAPIRAAISQKYSYVIGPYTAQQVSVAQKSVESDLAEKLMAAARLVEEARSRDLRKTQRWAAIGILLITAGSVSQGVAVLISPS